MLCENAAVSLSPVTSCRIVLAGVRKKSPRMSKDGADRRLGLKERTQKNNELSANAERAWVDQLILPPDWT
jgi:hypothetical protein